MAWSTADGTAVAGEDYVAASGTATFAPGETTRPVAIDVPPDLLDEDDETLFVNLSSPSGATIADGQGVGTIADDDPLPVPALDNVTVTEGDSGTTAATFTATLTSPSGRPVRATYASYETNDVKDSIYPVSGELLFRPGVTSLPIPVAVIGDRRHEADGTFELLLSSPVNVVIAPGGGQGLVLDNDADGPSVSDVRVVEPSATAATQAAFTLAGPTTGPLTVTYTTVNGTATAGSDYVPVSGELTLEPGQTTTALVPLLTDSVAEAPETFTLSLRDPATGSELASGTATLYDFPVGGDLDSDGKLDITWRQAGTGTLSVWLMNGFLLRSDAPTTPAALADSNWEGAGSADFNADGHSDILWRHKVSGKTVVWLMNGLVRDSSVFTNPDGAASASWVVIGTGDFNADHKPDILWYNVTSGKTVVWLMDGLTRTTGLFTTPDGVSDLSWQPQGVGDFDGDGDADILWRNAASGAISLWLMNGTVRDVDSPLAPVEYDLDWEVAAIGDYDRDGRSDILWRHRTSGALHVWTLDGALRLSNQGTAPAGRDTTWSVIGPR